MAVTLTLEQLADHLRIERAAVASGTILAGILSEMLALATATVEKYAVDAPESALNVAAARMVGYAYDAPPAPAATAYAAIMVNSGAASLLNPWRSARAEIVPAIGLPVAEPEPTPTPTPETILTPAYIPHPGSHFRYVGWSIDTTVTSGELANGQQYSGDDLTIPDGGPGHVWFAVDADAGYPDALFYQGNPTNLLSVYTRQAGMVTVNQVDYLVGISSLLGENAEGIVIQLRYNP